MPVKIVADFTGALGEVVNATKGLRAAILQAAGATARATWIQMANQTLNTSRSTYVMGIQSVKITGNEATVALVGQMPNAIENGMPQIDMHDTLLGPNVPEVPIGERGKHLIKHGPKKGGYYRAVPFRHATPGTVGQVGAEMGSAYGRAGMEEWRELGQKIYAAAKELSATTGKPGSKRPVRYGDRLEAGLAPKLKDHHATDIYAGMIRSEKTYQKATQSQYTTFRTISTGSPGWIRPATPGINLADKVKSHVESQLSGIVQAMVSQFGKGNR